MRKRFPPPAVLFFEIFRWGLGLGGCEKIVPLTRVLPKEDEHLHYGRKKRWNVLSAFRSQLRWSLKDGGIENCVEDASKKAWISSALLTGLF